jgi:phage terminase large subunit GpA-like protein
VSVVYTGRRFNKNAYTREKKLCLEEWAGKNVIFTSEDVSPILGNFKIKYSPHYKKLFKITERNLTRKMFGKWASQSGKSLYEIIVAAHKLDQNPATVIYAQPIKEDVPKILTLKINPIFKSIPKLWKKFEDYSNQEKFRTKDAMKRVAGGAFVIAGSSVKERKQLTSPLVILDEIGEFEKGAVKEFSERTKAFSRFNPLVIGVSTIVDPEDEICSNYNTCEVKLEWRFICDNCEKDFYPGAETLKIISKEKYKKEISENYSYPEYVKYAVEKTHIECPCCGSKINESKRTKMILENKLDWFIIKEDGSSTRLEIENLNTETSFGFDMNSLGSYFATLDDIAKEYIEAIESENKNDLLDKFYRGWLNKFYEPESVKTDVNDILLLSNNLPEFEVPQDTLRVYIGVDMQKDHFWYNIQAFTYGNISHSLSSGRLETWGDIEDLYVKCWDLKDSAGKPHIVSKMGIDKRGYNQDGVRRTDEAISFVEYMTNKYGSDKVYLIEGHPDIKSSPNGYVIKNVKDQSSNRTTVDIKMLKVSNLYFKNKMSEDIARSIENQKSEEEIYSQRLFYVNKDTIESDMEKTISTSYSKQMTSETFDYHINQKTKKRNPTQTWDMPKKTDNHIWDCTMICYVFAEVEKIALMEKPSATNIEKAIARMDF